jgi:hypothetical protein
MSLAGGNAGRISLRAAMATVQRDRQWWLLCLGYGFAAATGIGLPLAAGFVMESLDNSRRGYPTPLPPWSDPLTRYFTGFFALLIDFAFFLLPIFIGALLMLCASITLVIGASGGGPIVSTVLLWIGAIVGAFILFMFFSGVAPAGRLRFAREGRIEEAISGDTWRWTIGPHGRRPFLQARLASLPTYLPAIVAAAATVAISREAFTGQIAAIAAGLWLTMAALVYAHLVVVQLYVTAEKEVQRRELGM